MFPLKFILDTLAVHPLSSSTPGWISSLHSHEGNDYFWLALIGVRYATVQSWEFLVCLRNKSDSWIMIGLYKTQCLRTLLRCCHQNRKKKKKSNFTLNGVVITVGNFSLLPIIYLQRIFLKGTILENSVPLWCLQKQPCKDRKKIEK